MNEEFYNRLFEERMGEIIINLNNIISYFKCPNISPINFIKCGGPFQTFNEIINGNISLQKEEEDQKKLNQI